MNIGEAAKAAGLSAKMIRHYEEIGLIPPATRTDAGYRTYGPAEVRTLRFIRQARRLGFSLTELPALLRLWQDGDRASADVKALALAHIRDLDARIAELEAMRSTLQGLAALCHGDGRAECAILDALDPEG